MFVQMFIIVLKFKKLKTEVLFMKFCNILIKKSQMEICTLLYCTVNIMVIVFLKKSFHYNVNSSLKQRIRCQLSNLR
jgi:hypothetical protein